MTQCSVGRFNLGGNEESLSFYLTIQGEDGKPVSEGDAKAILHYSGEPSEEDDFREWKDNLAWVFQKCWDYAGRVFGSTDYKANALLFAQMYHQHFDELTAAFEETERVRIEGKIERLQRELQNLGLDDCRADMTATMMKEVARYEKWITEGEAELAQLLPGSELAEKKEKSLAHLRGKLALFSGALNEPLPTPVV